MTTTLTVSSSTGRVPKIVITDTGFYVDNVGAGTGTFFLDATTMEATDGAYDSVADASANLGAAVTVYEGDIADIVLTI